jgi:DNA invertase Pin-like site-specific DNA recombinase
MGKVYSYIRFSTPEQAKGDSKRRQLEAAKQFAAHHKLELAAEESFEDLGVSAFRGQNVAGGALRSFLRAIEDGAIEPGSVIVLENVDRLSREGPWEALPTLQQIINSGVGIGIPMKGNRLITRDDLRGSGGAWLLMELLVDLERAADESRTKSRRLRAVWNAKRDAAAEKVLTRRVPAWIAVNSDRTALNLIPERAKIVKRIFELFINGKGKHAIAAQLNTDHVPTFGRAGHWQSTYVHKILNNRAAIGELIPHTMEFDETGKKKRTPQDPVPGYYPPVVDEETFERAQALLSAGAPTRGRHAVRKVRNVLASLARCPLCGSTMTRVSKGSKTKAGQPFLVCVKAKTGAGCEYRSVKVGDIESAILRNAKDLPRNCPHPDESLQRELEDVEAALANVETQIGNLVDVLAQRPSAAVSKQLTALEAKAAPIRQHRDALNLKAMQTDVKLVRRRVERLKAALAGKTLDVPKANAALRECFEHVVIDYPHGGHMGHLVFEWRHGGETRLPFAFPRPERR